MFTQRLAFKEWIRFFYFFKSNFLNYYTVKLNIFSDSSINFNACINFKPPQPQSRFRRVPSLSRPPPQAC